MYRHYINLKNLCKMDDSARKNKLTKLTQEKVETMSIETIRRD